MGKAMWNNEKNKKRIIAPSSFSIEMRSNKNFANPIWIRNFVES